MPGEATGTGTMGDDTGGGRMGITTDHIGIIIGRTIIITTASGRVFPSESEFRSTASAGRTILTGRAIMLRDTTSHECTAHLGTETLTRRGATIATGRTGLMTTRSSLTMARAVSAGRLTEDRPRTVIRRSAKQVVRERQYWRSL
jgi:hypothetical protein